MSIDSFLLILKGIFKKKKTGKRLKQSVTGSMTEDALWISVFQVTSLFLSQLREGCPFIQLIINLLPRVIPTEMEGNS